MYWIKKKFRTWLNIDRLVKNEIEKQCQVIAKAVERGDYPWDSEARSVALVLQRVVQDNVRNLSNSKVRAQVSEVVKGLKINEEKFLDEIVIRLKAKQVY